MCGNNSALYNMILMLCGRMCLSLYSIPIIREHLLVIIVWVFFQFKFQAYMWQNEHSPANSSLRYQLVEVTSTLFHFLMLHRPHTWLILRYANILMSLVRDSCSQIQHQCVILYCLQMFTGSDLTHDVDYTYQIWHDVDYQYQMWHIMWITSIRSET